MPEIRFGDHSLAVAEGASVLETLLSAQCEIPNNCRAGVCQACLMQLVEGEVEPPAQRGLKESWQAQGLFLACQCHPERDLEIRLPGVEAVRSVCSVSGHDRLSGDLLRLRLRPESEFHYRPGQYVTLWRDQALGRSYSLASVPALDGDELELHIRHYPQGRLSGWLYEQVRVGDRLQLQGPAGDCFYTGGDPEQPLLLAATGTGLAPLYGILRDALNQGHAGPIHLYHGALDPAGLYLHHELQGLATAHANLTYHPCSRNAAPGMDEAIQVACLDDLLGQEMGALQGWRVYLCGPGEFVKAQQRRCFLAGAGIQEIYADAFL